MAAFRAPLAIEYPYNKSELYDSPGGYIDGIVYTDYGIVACMWFQVSDNKSRGKCRFRICYHGTIVSSAIDDVPNHMPTISMYARRFAEAAVQSLPIIKADDEPIYGGSGVAATEDY